jgi:hypothetical protein
MTRGDRTNRSSVQPVLFAGVRAEIESVTLVMLAGRSDDIYLLRYFESDSDRQDLGRFERYRILVRGVRDAIAAAGSPVAVAIESCELLVSRRYHLHVLEHGALLRYSLLAAGLALTEVPPITVRQFATGDSWARDPLVTERLEQAFGASLYGPGETMAYALAQIARCLVHPENYDPRRRQTLSGVLPPHRGHGRVA